MTKLKLKNKRMIKRKPTVRKKKVGRPTKYRPEFCQQMIEWFDRELTILKEVEKISPCGAITIMEEKPNKPPMFGDFARNKIKTNHQTMLEWTKKFPEFNEAYKECKEIQQEFIIMGCLMGHLNSSFGRFTMKNISDWRDKIETDSSKDEKEDNTLKLAYSLQALNDTSS